MENSAPQTWSPPIALVLFGWLFTLCASAWVGFAQDAVDRLFAGVLAVTLLGASLHGSVLRPRLAADSDGVRVRRVTGRRSWTWAQLRVRVVRSQRLGRTVHLLELDDQPQHRNLDDPTAHESASGRLVILGKLDLGADPQDVEPELALLRDSAK